MRRREGGGGRQIKRGTRESVRERERKERFSVRWMDEWNLSLEGEGVWTTYEPMTYGWIV